MTDGYNTFTVPASDAASTRSSSSFASTVGLLKEKKAAKENKNKANKDKAKKQTGSITGTARYTSTLINQC